MEVTKWSGVIKLLIFEGIKQVMQMSCMVIMEGFPNNTVLFGLVL